MDTRFQAEDRVCRQLFQLLPTHIIALSCVEIDEIANKLVSFWGNDLETPSSLRSEMITWQIGEKPIPTANHQHCMNA